MRISLKWLQEYVDVRESGAEVASLLTMSGLEVSSVEVLGEGVEGVVVAQILSRNPHPDADRLSLCRVADGCEEYDIVCGATNMGAGDKVALARVGATLPGGFKIKKAKIRGQSSSGMLCSERELGLSEESSGIMILPADAPLGRPLLDYLGLPDSILEVEITPNRPDCLSVIGVARELAAVTGRVLKTPAPRVRENGPPIEGETSVEIRAPELCHRYAARLLRGVRLGPSPDWLARRLQSAGIRSISNVVDVTNYVLLEFGHPLHAFDFAKLRGGRIVVYRAREGEVFATLDGQERTLDAEALVIADGEGAVALAGIMGGLNSEVGDDTVDVLLESAYFLPTNIRKTSKRLGLRTEASYRFERGTDIDGLRVALDRAAELILEFAGGQAARGVWDAYPTRHEPRRILFRPARASRLLGIEVSPEAAEKSLGSLGLTALERSAEGTVFEVPTHRVDLEREVDLTEEVARLIGYGEIPASLPRVPMTAERSPASVTLADAARDALRAQGLREAVSLSFIDPAEDDRLGLAAEAALRAKVAVANPLSRDTAVMRTTLVAGLLRAAGLNVRRQAREVRLFEVGRTFHPEESAANLPREVLRAGAVLAGRRSAVAWWAGADAVDFFDAKGLVEALLGRLGVRQAGFEPAADLPWLQPGRAARVFAGPNEVGWVGQIHPDRLDAYELVGPVVAFEIELEAAAREATTLGAFPGLARYPAVERDIALLVDRQVPCGAAVEAIHSVGSPLLRSVVLFDAFEGGRLPPGKVSLGFRLTYRSDERTLTEDEVSTLEEAIVVRLGERVGARLRDS